jgi:hypothetical protein
VTGTETRVAVQTRGGRRSAVRPGGGSFTVRRLRSSRLLLGTVFAAVLISAAVAGALVTLGLRTLPAAAVSQFEGSAGTSVNVSGQVTLAQAGTDTAAVRSALHAAFGPTPVALDSALWSEPLRFPGLGRAAAPAGVQVLGQAAALDAITAHARLTAGSWPGGTRAGAASQGGASQPGVSQGGPIPVAVPAVAAGQLDLTVGERLTVRNDYTGSPVKLLITGLYAPRQPDSAYWQLSLLGAGGSSLQGATLTYGPLITGRAAFQSGRLSVIAATWHAVPALRRIAPGDYTAAAGRIAAATQHLADPTTYGLVVTTALPQLLPQTGRSLTVARSLLLIGALQMLLLAAASIALAARLLTGQREQESALLSARGMARRQLAGRAAAEAALTVIPAVAGAVAGSLVAGLVVRVARLPAAGPVPLSVWATAAAITTGATLIMIWPVLSPADPGTASVRRGRQAALASTARAGADVVLLAIAAIAIWQLRLYAQAPPGAPASLGVYPVLSAAPTLAIAGAALIPLRILPLLARGLDRLSDRTNRLGVAFTSWQLSRRPIRQSGPALLVILAVAIGTIALAERQSWHQSVVDQADFAVGTPVRVDLATPLPLGTGDAIAAAPGVRVAMPVARATQTGGAQLLAIGTRQAAATVLLRPDLAAGPAAQLWRSITPAGSPPGLALPGRPARLVLTARISGSVAGALGPLAASVSVQDADGIVYSVPAGTLSAHRHRLVAVLAPGRPAAYPLRLLGISLAYVLPARPVRGTATVAVTGLAASPAVTGPAPAGFATGAALRSWQAAVTVPAAYHGTAALALPVLRPAATFAPATMTIKPGSGVSAAQAGIQPIPAQLTLTAPDPDPVLPAIASRAFLTAAQVQVGDTVPVTISGVTLSARIVAVVRAVPSAGGAQGALIVDQAGLQEQLAARSDPPAPVTQWWLRPTGRRPLRLPAGAVRADAGAVAAAQVAQPLNRVQQTALLLVAVAAAMLAALGFAVSVAATLRERRTQMALLAALGVSRRERTRQLCLEQFLLSAPAAGAGLLLGCGLAWLLVPAVTRTGLGLPPFPPALVQIPLLASAGLALAVTVIPVLAAGLTVAYQPDPAARLRTPEDT